MFASTYIKQHQSASIRINFSQFQSRHIYPYQLLSIHKYQPTSTFINLCQFISTCINFHQLAINLHQKFNSSKQHRSVSIRINFPQSTSTYINFHQAVSIHITLHQTISTCIEPNQLSSSRINPYQPESNDINLHRTTSTSINLHQPISTHISSYSQGKILPWNQKSNRTTLKYFTKIWGLMWFQCFFKIQILEMIQKYLFEGIRGGSSKKKDHNICYQKGFLLSKFSWSANCWRNPGLGRMGRDWRIVWRASAEDMPFFIMR